MRILFFGTSVFAAKILSYLLQHHFPIVAVVTQPDRPRGRHLHSAFSPVKEAALAANILILQPEKISTPEYAEILKSYRADLFLVVAYGEIIKKALLDIPRLGAFNIHASLLPKYRGAAPIQRCLMHGDKRTGINIIAMTAQMDAGDVVASREISIPEEMTYGECEETLGNVACSLTLTFFQQLAQGKIEKIPQDPHKVTFAPKLQPEEERIDWNMPAQELHNLIRALSPIPGAWSPIYQSGQEKRLKILRSRIHPLSHAAAPGALLSTGRQGLIVACKEEALELLEVQLEGKKKLSVKEFFNGLQQPIAFSI
jgi:methionyl-tRNA formyltransferase